MEYFLHILVITGIYVILTLSLNLVVGYTGLAALGHAAFSCVGAYASSLLALNYGLSPWIGLIVGASAIDFVKKLNGVLDVLRAIEVNSLLVFVLACVANAESIFALLVAPKESTGQIVDFATCA